MTHEDRMIILITPYKCPAFAAHRCYLSNLSIWQKVSSYFALSCLLTIHVCLNTMFSREVVRKHASGDGPGAIGCP